MGGFSARIEQLEANFRICGPMRDQAPLQGFQQGIIVIGAGSICEGVAL